MFYDNELLFLQKMLNKCHLQTLIVNPFDKIDQRIDSGFRNFFKDYSYNETYFEFFPEIKHKTIYRVTDIFLCRYIFFELPFCDNKTLFIIGPYINNEITSQQILELGEKIGFSAKISKELENFYVCLPIIKEENHILAMVHTFADFLWNGSENYDSLDITRNIPVFFSSAPLLAKPTNADSNFNIKHMEKRYDFENELMVAISQGNTQKAEQMLSGFSSLSFEKRIPDRLRNMKNYCIIMNTLFRKAAETGGVHPVYLDRVSSEFAKRIEELLSTHNIKNFMLEIVRTYCQLVKRQSVKNYSPLVRAAIIKIENDLTCDLSLSAIAKLNNVSPNYFSAIFKNETGQTLTEYVTQKRLSHAKYLLKNTNLQIQTIAQHCGILDFHYFCRTFKKNIGITPTEYRNNLLIS